MKDPNHLYRMASRYNLGLFHTIFLYQIAEKDPKAFHKPNAVPLAATGGNSGKRRRLPWKTGASVFFFFGRFQQLDAFEMHALIA